MSFNPRKSKSTRHLRTVKKQLFMPSKGVSCSSGKRVFTTRTDAWKSLIARQTANAVNALDGDTEALARLAQMEKGYTYPVRYFYADECELGFFE